MYQTAGSKRRHGRVRCWSIPHLGEEPVHKYSLVLSEAVDPKDTLDIIGGVPRGVKDDDPVGSHQVDPQRASPCWNEEQTTSGESTGGGGQTHVKMRCTQWKPLTLAGPLPDVAGVVEFFCPLLPCGSAGGAVQAVVVNVPEPFAFTFTSTSQLESPLTVQCSRFMLNKQGRHHPTTRTLDY